MLFLHVLPGGRPGPFMRAVLVALVLAVVLGAAVRSVTGAFIRQAVRSAVIQPAPK